MNDENWTWKLHVFCYLLVVIRSEALRIYLYKYCWKGKHARSDPNSQYDNPRVIGGADILCSQRSRYCVVSNKKT